MAIDGDGMPHPLIVVEFEFESPRLHDGILQNRRFTIHLSRVEKSFSSPWEGLW